MFKSSFFTHQNVIDENNVLLHALYLMILNPTNYSAIQWYNFVCSIWTFALK